MPSTYTTNNGIEKIATGDQSGTWGATTNTNFDLLDESIDGTATVTLGAVGTSGSPNTLSITDGASSDGRHRYVIFNDGGDLGGTAYVQLNPNDAEKLMFVRNSLSGSRDIIIFQGTYNASNDYVIANGTDALLRFNGGGSGAVVTAIYTQPVLAGATITGGTIDNSVIGGTTPAAGSFTTLTASTSADLTALDDTTIGATTPSTGAFTTITASTSADLTALDDTIIGGTTPAAGSFTVLKQNGSVVLNQRATYGGTADAITLTTGASLSSLTTGMRLWFRATSENTGATTINVDGIGAVTALPMDVSASGLPAGYIRTDADTEIFYNGTNWKVHREVEYISNSNGYATRWEDGSQMCGTTSKTVNYNAANLKALNNTTTITFAAAFDGVPVYYGAHYETISHAGSTNKPGTVEAYNVTATTIQLRMWKTESQSGFASGDSGTMNYYAVGYWYS